MYSEELEELIALAIQDGDLTDQKRKIIERRAMKEGEDVEEVMMVVEARLSNIHNQDEVDYTIIGSMYIADVRDRDYAATWREDNKGRGYEIPPRNLNQVMKLVIEYNDVLQKMGVMEYNWLYVFYFSDGYLCHCSVPNLKGNTKAIKHLKSIQNKMKSLSIRL